MAEYTQDVGFEGGASNMVPASYVSRIVDGAAVGFGVPVKQGATDKSCAEGIGADDFIGITVHEFGKAQFEEDDEARVMTQGVIWVKVTVAVEAGDTVSYKTTSTKGWAKSTGDNHIILDNARYETSADSGGLAQVRLWGTNTTAGA